MVIIDYYRHHIFTLEITQNEVDQLKLLKNGPNRCVWPTGWLTDRLTEILNKRSTTYNHVSGRKNIRRILSHKVTNVVTMVVGGFWSTEINFWPISTHEGSISVSDIVLVHFQGPQVTSDVKKPVWVKSLVNRDREWTHISELSQGSPWAKMTIKTILEGAISM